MPVSTSATSLHSAVVMQHTASVSNSGTHLIWHTLHVNSACVWLSWEELSPAHPQRFCSASTVPQAHVCCTIAHTRLSISSPFYPTQEQLPQCCLPCSNCCLTRCHLPGHLCCLHVCNLKLNTQSRIPSSVSDRIPPWLQPPIWSPPSPASRTASVICSPPATCSPKTAPSLQLRSSGAVLG